ncbi:MAG: hypothetical protein AAGG38_07820 [Planctomycetota bacterium]
MRLPRLTAAMLLVAVMTATGCKNHVVYREKGYDQYRAADYAAAADNFREAVKLKPGDFRSQYYLAASLLKQDQAIAAQIPLERALTLRGGDPEWRPRIADLLAESYYQQERFDTLYAFLDDQIRTYSQQTPDFLRKAKYLDLLGDADGQKIALQKAAYFAPADDATPYLAIADFYLTVNDVPNAIQALRFGYYVDAENEDVKDGLRGLGVVPGPTIADAPPKPEILD